MINKKMNHKKSIWIIAFNLFFIFLAQAQEVEKKNYKKQPAILTKLIGNEISLDFVQHNPKFDAGSSEDYFKNENKKIRTYKLSKNVRYYTCKSNFPTELSKIENVRKRFEKNKKKSRTTHYYYFDIKNNEITNIYEQCLP